MVCPAAVIRSRGTGAPTKEIKTTVSLGGSAEARGAWATQYRFEPTCDPRPGLPCHGGGTLPPAEVRVTLAGGAQGFAGGSFLPSAPLLILLSGRDRGSIPTTDTFWDVSKALATIGTGPMRPCSRSCPSDVPSLCGTTWLRPSGGIRGTRAAGRRHGAR